MEDDMGFDDLAGMSTGRSHVYGLLATVYRSELSVDVLRGIKEPRFLDALAEVGIQLGEDFLQAPEDQLIEELAVEYARLFIGPGEHISPHESVHHERDDGQWGTLWGASTVEVKKFIETTGLEYKPDYRGLPDHISVELEFMREVILKEGEAWRKGDREGALYCLKIEKRFMEEHLIRWVPELCDKVIEETKSPLYRGMARVTRNFVELERETIARHISEAEGGG